MGEHTQRDTPAVSQSAAEGQRYGIRGVQSGFWHMFGVRISQELLAGGFTPPPGPQPTVTAGEGSTVT